MNFMRIGSVVDNYIVQSRLDSGKRPWRQVFLTFRWENGEKVKYVMVVYDYVLTREAGKLGDNLYPHEVGSKDFFDGEDVGDDWRWFETKESLIKDRFYLYVTYKYVKGVRLDKLMKRKKLPKFGPEFMVDLCEAVNNISLITFGGGHNAISPENIIVKNLGGGKYKPYLIGYADVWEPVKRKKVCDVELLDHRFRAPETFVGGFSKYSDIYSLGMILCYIFGGDAIWDYNLEELQSMTEAQRRNVIKKFRCSVLDRVPFPEEEYYEIARKALELKPNDRFDSLTEMRHSFQSISEELKQFDLMCDKLFAMEVANKDKVFEKKYADSESSDFDAWLDKFIKEQLEGDPVTETTDGSIYYSGDDYTTDNSDDTTDSSDGTTDSSDDDPFDFNKRDDGALSAKVKINKRRGKGFSDVAGMDNLKGLLKRNFIDIVRNSEMAKMYNIKPSNGILLYGPPGCGKTYIAEKIAEEASLNFVMVKPSDLGSTYIHGTQTKIADLFKKAEKEAPALLCFDEFDTLVPSRDGDTSHSSLTEVNEFLVQLNNCASRGVYVLAMTNNINMIDGAVLRKGRIDEVIYVPEPDNVARREMFRLALEKCAMASKSVDCEKLSSLTEGYTSSDIAYIVIEASREAFHRAVEADAMVEVDQEVLEAVIKRTSPSVSPKDLKRYESMRDEFVNKKKQLDIRPRIGFAV